MDYDPNMLHWHMPSVLFCLGAKDVPGMEQFNVEACVYSIDAIRADNSSALESIAIPVTTSLHNGKKAVRKNFLPSLRRPDAVCLSYVQTVDGDIPASAASDWDWLRSRLSVNDDNSVIWCDKLPLDGDAGWWAKKAPLLYATQPILISPPTATPDLLPKMRARDPQEQLLFAALLSTDTHFRSCENCKRELTLVLRHILTLIVDTSKRHPNPGIGARQLINVDVQRVTDAFLEAEMVPPGWRNRMWPRMEATVAIQARGAVLSPRGFYGVARLVLFQHLLFSWALFYDDKIEKPDAEQSDGTIGMARFFQPIVHVFNKCHAFKRFDKGVWISVMTLFKSNSSSYERSMLSRTIAVDGDYLAAQYALQFLSEQNSLNNENLWKGPDGLFRDVKNSLGAMALRITVMELLRVPIGVADIFDPADIILWKKEVYGLALPDNDTAPELHFVNEHGRYSFNIRQYDHCAFGVLSGPYLEMAWMRHCSQIRVNAGEEKWRLNREILESASAVKHYYRASIKSDSIISFLMGEHPKDRAVCQDHSTLEYERVGFSVVWSYEKSTDDRRGLLIWFVSVNEEVRSAHLDNMTWVLEEQRFGGADDPLVIHCEGTKLSGLWAEERGRVCAECGKALGTWAFSSDEGDVSAYYSSGIGALPLWLPYRLH